MALLTSALRAFRDLGYKPMALYALYRIQLGSGWLRRRTPHYAWRDRPLEWWLHSGVSTRGEDFFDSHRRQGAQFFLRMDDDFTTSLKEIVGEARKEVVQEAENILNGTFRLFGIRMYELGFPPRWDRFMPLTEDTPPDVEDSTRHWSKYEASAFKADVKLLWEPARFGWIFPLMRAYWLTGESRFAEAVWTLVDSWCESHPPNSGPHWLSAQEVALRLMTLVFALHTSLDHLAGDRTRFARLLSILAAHAARIPATLVYARAQRNNHLLVEAAALYTAGVLFPQFRDAEAWRGLGLHWFEQALSDQVFSDGGYIQHSTNYHRLALQTGLWTARIAQANQESLSESSYSALRHLTRALAALADTSTGNVPNFGPNDGAHFLPLAVCTFEDMRPTIQAASLAFFGEEALGAGPWDELSLWLGLKRNNASRSLPDGQEVARSTVSREASGAVTLRSQEEREDGDFARKGSFPEAGLYCLRGRASWGMLRCAHFHSRPGHSDQLHFDLWWHGMNVACDPGTYLYNGEAPWDNSLAGAKVHNTVVLDDREPMRKAGRFLWLDWSCGRVLGRWRSPAGAIELLSAEHDGYSGMGVSHRRSIARIGDDNWLIVDDLLGREAHQATLGWTLPDRPWQLNATGLTLKLGDSNAWMHVEGPTGETGLYRAGEWISGVELEGALPQWGWRSRTYALKEPALRFVYRVEATLPLRVCSWWAFNKAESEEFNIEWSAAGEGGAAIRRIAWKGQVVDTDDAHLIDTSGVHSAG